MSQFIDFASKSTNPDNDKVFDIDPEEVFEKKDQIQLIDVRRPPEFEGELGHIEGAKLIVLDYLPQKFKEIDPEKTIVFVCRSGRRSETATNFIQDQGYKSAYNLKGGMIAWNEKNLPVIKG